MHISGKVAVFFVILLGGVAFVLSTQLLDFQTSWLKQVNDNQKKLVDAKKSTADKRKKLAALQSEYDQIMLGWDTYINNATATADPATGTLSLNIGPPVIAEKKDKEGKPVMPVIFAFQPSADGKQYEYVGEFRAEQIGPANSLYQANWRVRPADTAGWRPGPNWRVRTRIPSSDKLRFDEMSFLMSDVDERLNANANELQRTRDEFAKKIKLALANRENELQGFESLQPERGKIDDEMIDGVLLTMVKEEETRNAALAKADQLRHDLHKTVQQFETISQSNSKATAALPHSTPVPPATASAKP